MDPVASEFEAANVVEETPTCPEMMSNLQLSPSLGTKATDTPVSANTSQADRESGVGDSYEKSPHSQADAKPAETAMPEDTTHADEGLDSGEIHEKPLYSQTSDITMGLDTSEADRERSDGATFGQIAAEKAIRLGTKATDTAVSANTSQVDQDPGAGASHEKSPHSQADAKPAETAMPVGTTQADEGLDSGEIHEKPTYSQTETNLPNTTMGLDTSEADEERSDDATFGEKAIRLGSLFDALPKLSQKHDILRQLYGKLMGNRVLVLIGEAGSGKTTAAILLAQYASIWCGGPISSLHFDGNKCLPKTVTAFPCKSLIVIDDFLGKHDADGLSYWNAVVLLLQSVKDNADKGILLLLTSRTAIFKNLLSSEEAYVRLHLNENHLTTITTDYKKMWKDICEGVELKTPDFENLPSIGFPLCCQLAPHLAPDVQTILFQHPRLAVRRAVKTLMDSTGIARTALTLLAVTEGSLDMNIFKSSPRLQESKFYKILDILRQASDDKETPAQIAAFYRNCAFLLQVCDDAVSFRSEVIREAVLVVLCDSHAELLAKYCSLKLLSQIALATSDNDTSDDAEKPALSDSAKLLFLRRLMEEMKDADNYEAMFSSFFQHRSIVSMFENTVKEESLLKQWTQKCSQSGLHFVFYAGAVPSVFKSSLSELDMTNLWVVLQAVLACCYWGYHNDMDVLLNQTKTALNKALKEATILDIITGNLPGLSRREEPRWEMTPLFPEDTLLVLAARKGKDAVVEILVSRKINVNSQGMDGRTALMHYCARGKTNMVQFLLHRKADPMIRDKWGMTALTYALQQKQWDVPEELMITEGCRAANTYRQSPLTFACANKWNTQMIGALIAKGADIMQKDIWGYTCLHYACLHGHTDIVAYLLKEKKVDVRGKTAFGHTPLTLAVTSPGRSNLVKLLLNTEATRDAEDTNVTSMVCCASDLSVMKTLLSACHKKEDVKKLALREASGYGNTEMVRYLLQSGADTARKSPDEKYTPLHLACIVSSVDCCAILLPKSDANVESSTGATPLMYALEVGALDCARLLLRHGAKLDSISKLGSCLHYATLSNLCSALDWCIKEQKMDVNKGNSEGKTPLQVACEMGKYHSVKYLLDNGADILIVDVKGNTCMHHAARNGHWDVVKLLEKVDPSLMNVPNKKGETPAQLLKTAPTTQSASAE